MAWAATKWGFWLGATALSAFTPEVEEAAAEGEPVAAKGGTYLLRDEETEQVMRTGRTNDFVRRRLEHGRDPALRGLEFEPVDKTDVYAEQRGLEQILHETYNPPLNRINPISPLNPGRQSYLEAAWEFLHGGGL